MIEWSGDDLVATLQQLEEDVQERVVRPIAYAGARLLYDEVRLRVPVYEGRERKNIRPGQLRDAIYHVFAEDQSSDLAKFYEISWNASKAPHGHLIEYGHWIVRGKVGRGNAGPPRRVGWAPAIPFVRSSFDRAPDAVRAMQARAVEKVQEVLSRKIVDDFGNEVPVGDKHVDRG
ncbi:HK97 gp10 family phage protein [Cupriavidus plantarum]|uniref:HK97 gp10 family phage protein n=1 Tax=Cupriavidus plantarum TaxID=942865 RepID=UPI000EB24279|nr:HK97 gp10 family phage protein [Cupriavidus plantarum]RLK45949.1 bacteriophage HK97-gp10 putative tail-component [Cupriavidus plantarum]